MRYRYTDKDADTLGFRSKLDRELFVTAGGEGVNLPRAEVAKLVAELQKWLEETPKKLVKTTVPLCEVAVGEEFQLFGVNWRRHNVATAFVGAKVYCTQGNLRHCLSPVTRVEVTREAVVSEPEVKPEPVAPRRTPGPETSPRKATSEVQVSSLEPVAICWVQCVVDRHNSNNTSRLSTLRDGASFWMTSSDRVKIEL